METQHETECQIKEIRHLRQEGSGVLVQCEEARTDFAPEQVGTTKQ